MTEPAAKAFLQIQRFLRSGLSIVALFLTIWLPVASADAAASTWGSLSPSQQEALAPLAQQWDTLPEEDQHRWVKTAKRYPSLSPKQKKRFRNRVDAWNKLTPEQRKAAREKYRAFKKVPKEKREQVKQMIKQEEAKKTEQPSVDAPAAELPPKP